MPDGWAIPDGSNILVTLLLLVIIAAIAHSPFVNTEHLLVADRPFCGITLSFTPAIVFNYPLQCNSLSVVSQAWGTPNDLILVCSPKCSGTLVSFCGNSPTRTEISQSAEPKFRAKNSRLHRATEKCRGGRLMLFWPFGTTPIHSTCEGDSALCQQLVCCMYSISQERSHFFKR